MGSQASSYVRQGERERGGTAVEYALMGSLIAMAIVAAVRLIGPALIPYFDAVAAAL